MNRYDRYERFCHNLIEHEWIKNLDLSGHERGVIAVVLVKLQAEFEAAVEDAVNQKRLADNFVVYVEPPQNP